MKAIVKIANVYNEILEETNEELVVEKDGKVFLGALFFQVEEWEKVQDTIDEVVVDGNALDIVMAAYELKEKHGMLAKDGKSLMTMLHWQYTNGVTDEMFIDSYRCKNDQEFIERFC